MTQKNIYVPIIGEGHSTTPTKESVGIDVSMTWAARKTPAEFGVGQAIFSDYQGIVCNSNGSKWYNNGVDITNSYTPESFPIPQNITGLLKPAHSPDLGTLVSDHLGTNYVFTAPGATTNFIIPGTRTSKRSAAPVAKSVDHVDSNIARLTAPGTDTVNGYTTCFTVGGVLTTVLDTDIANIGFFATAMPRLDTEPYGSLFVRVGSKASASNGVETGTAGTAYYDTRLAIKADGKQRFYVLSINNLGATNAPADGKGNFDHAQDIGAIRFSQPPTADSCKPTRNPANNIYWSAGDTVYIGNVYINCRGMAKAIIRYDDNIRGTYIGTYKNIVNPSKLVDYIPNLTSSSYPDANSRCFANDSYGTGYAFKGKSGLAILNGEDISIAEIIKRAGFAATAFILCRLVGAPNFLTVAQLRTLQNTYGWLVAFQTYWNPLGSYQQGLKLLGPQGYNIVGTKYTSNASSAIPAVQAIETANSKPTMRLINIGAASATAGSGTAVMTTQGFPVVFAASDDLPAALTPGVVYWLKEQTSSLPNAHDTLANVSVHNNEIDAGNSSNAIDIVTGYSGTASNITFRYRYSKNDYTGPLDDFIKGKEWFIENGFGKGYKTYAPNQGAIDEHVEMAIETFGEIKHIWNFGNNSSFVEIPYATPAMQSNQISITYGAPNRTFQTMDELMLTTYIPTDNYNLTNAVTGVASTDVLTLTNPPANLQIIDGESCYFTSITGGAGLTAAIGTVYFLRDVSGATFKLAATKGGTAINFTTDISAGTLQLSDTAIRQFVRNAVYSGGVFSNISHDTSGILSTRQMVWYLDELLYWVQQGMLVVDTADVIGDMILNERL